MIWNYTKYSRVRFLFLAALAFAATTTWAEGVSPKRPPTFIPFDLARIPATYEMKVEVVDPTNYTVDVEFYITLPHEYSHFLDRRHTPEEARKISGLLGGGVDPVTGKWIMTGVPAKFRVTVSNYHQDKPILSELVDHPDTLATYMGRYAELVKLKLLPGIYIVKLEYAEGATALATLHAEILFAKAHHGK